jgi:RNA polymerase sigma-70 factor (ECF subfamily)
MVDRSLDDAGLATLALGGDVEALAGLFERYRPSLYAAAVRILRDRDDALDAVQETFLTALVRLHSLRDPGAVGGWLHAVLRNACLIQLRSGRRDVRGEPPPVDLASLAAGPDEVLDRHALRDWLWAALARLGPDERVTVVLRHFTRCDSYAAIAAVTGVPVGTVRSRLARARSQLAASLRGSLASSPLSSAGLERARLAEWEHFYAELHDAPLPRTYWDTYAPDVVVTDHVGAWAGVEDWSAHEREAIQLGVRATIVGLVAGPDHTILEIDFSNPDWSPDHCPPRSTFVHRLAAGRSRRLDIHYV